MTEKTPAFDPLAAGFTPMAEDEWPEHIEDRWPAGRLRKTAMAAYNEMARVGEIKPMGVYRGRSEAVLVRYMAKLPEQWVHELLAKAERKLGDDGKRDDACCAGR